MRIEKTSNRTPTQEEYNLLVDAVNLLLSERVVSVGPGLEMRKSSGGTAIASSGGGSISDIGWDDSTGELYMIKNGSRVVIEKAII